LELTDGEFFLEYCEVVDLGVAQRVSLIAAEDHTCVLLKDGQCAVYEARPLQCRTYPFWGIHLADPESWQRASKSCPGIGQGRLWSRKQIDECVDSRERDPLLDVLSDPDG
jgi:Fe-S-cluster containining protein